MINLFTESSFLTCSDVCAAFAHIYSNGSLTFPSSNCQYLLRHNTKLALVVFNIEMSVPFTESADTNNACCFAIIYAER